MMSDGIIDRRDQVCETLADAGARLGQQMMSVIQSRLHRDAHLQLLRTLLEIGQLRGYRTAGFEQIACGHRESPVEPLREHPAQQGLCQDLRLLDSECVIRYYYTTISTEEEEAMLRSRMVCLWVVFLFVLTGSCSRNDKPGPDTRSRRLQQGDQTTETARSAVSEKKSIPVRGYLIHLTHYDPNWYDRKKRERPFDLEIGREMVRALAKAGFNMLIIDLADAVEYRSLPELKRHYSVPMAHLKTLIACARDEGLEIVPKLNFSKSKQPRRAHNYWFRPYNKLPDTREYWAKAFELIDEIISVCKPERFFFIGMDEDFQRTPAQYTAAVRSLHAGLAKRGLRTVMWNDTMTSSAGMFGCIQKTLAAEDGTDKDIVHVAWDYGPPRARTAGRIKDMVDKGLEVWIAPGRNPQQVKEWKQLALQIGCPGLVMTAWRPVTRWSREGFLNGIRTVGPIYARPEAVQAEPVFDLSVPPTRHVVQANMQPTTQPMDEPILAPNHLGEPFKEMSYLLPPQVYVRNWMMLGPFRFQPEKYTGSQQQEVIEDDGFVEGPEERLVAQKPGTAAHGVTWRRYAPSADSAFPQVIDLTEPYGKLEYALAYLVAHVHSDRDVKGYSLYLGSDDYVKVWLNGQLIHTYAERKRAVAIDDDKIQGIALRKGWNKLLVKCANATADWGLLLRIADEKDRPLTTR